MTRDTRRTPCAGTADVAEAPRRDTAGTQETAIAARSEAAAGFAISGRAEPMRRESSLARSEVPQAIRASGEPSSSALAAAPRAAVALAYRTGDIAPRVVARGRGVIAEEILERARAAGVHVHESRELASLLLQVELDHAIPAQLYVAVAELLAWLYRNDRKAAAVRGGPGPGA
jgi:flagellar biosynthesis protein